MLYAYRWQVELFFRCIKRTLDALHLWNHEPNGVKIQFYLYLIVYVLLIHFKQTLVKEKESQKEDPASFKRFFFKERRSFTENRKFSIASRIVVWFLFLYLN